MIGLLILINIILGIVMYYYINYVKNTTIFKKIRNGDFYFKIVNWYMDNDIYCKMLHDYNTSSVLDDFMRKPPLKRLIRKEDITYLDIVEEKFKVLNREYFNHLAILETKKKLLDELINKL